MCEVPQHEISHDFDETEDVGLSGVGNASTLDMSNQAKAAARKQRKRLEEIGGFGFQCPR